MFIKAFSVKPIKFSDIAEFSDEEEELTLVDVVNDVTREKNENDFLTTPGAYVYELDLTVDRKKIYDLNVESFEVKIYDRNPSRKRRKQRKKRSQWAKLKRQDQRTFLKSAPKPIFETKVDLGVKLSMRGFSFVKPSFLPKPKTYSVFLDKLPKTQGKLLPAKIMAAPIYSTPKITLTNNTATSQMKAAFKNKKDPMSILSTPMPIFPSLASKTSLGGGRINDPYRIKQSDTIALDNIRVRRSLEQTRNGLEERKPISTFDYRLANSVSNNKNISLGSSLFLGFKASIRNYNKRIRRRIEIPKKLLGTRRNFYVEITPIVREKPGVLMGITQTKSSMFSVKHQDQLEDMMEPQVPPQITVVRESRGNIVLRVKQGDPVTSKLKIAKMYTTCRKNYTPSNLETMETIDTSDSATSYIITDTDAQNILPNNVVYRAIPYGPKGHAGPAASFIVGGLPAPIKPPPEDPNALSLIAKNEIDRVEITVGNIPDDVFAIRLLREELGKAGSLYERVTSISNDDNETMVTVVDDDVAIFYDYDAHIGRKYRYFCSMRPKFGSEFLSEEDELFIRLFPTKSIPVEVSIENPSLSGNQNEFTFEFDIVSTPRNDNIDFVLDILRKSGVSSVFIDEIDKQRSDFADLAVFVVERADRVTGRRVSFGLVPPGKFSDSPELRKKVGLPNIEPDGRYIYYVKLCLRPPESLMKSVFAKFSSAQTPGVDNKEALAQKFLSVYSEQFGGSPGGALPSSAELINGMSVSDSIKAGDTGIVLETELRTPDRKPTPENLRVRKHKYRGAMLWWKSSPGDIQSVDHCLVFADVNGQKICLGTVASDGTNTRFRFNDRKYFSTPGKIKYTVKYVYRDMNISPECRSALLHNWSFTPKRLLTGRFLGVKSWR